MLKLGFVLVAALAIGCDLDDDDERDDIDDVDDIDDIDGDQLPPPDTTPFTWTANMTGNDIYSSLTGSSMVELIDEGSFTATISMRGDIAGAVRPWHVHFGTCGSGGAIVGPPEAYPVLRVSSDGSSEAQTNVLFALDQFAQYHVNVHESPENLATLIACGDLVRSR